MRRFCGVVMSLLLVILTGCGPKPPKLPETTYGGGWFISTGFVPQYGPIVPAPYTTVLGTWVSDLSNNAAGDPSTFRLTTNDIALGTVDNGRVNANWSLEWVSSTEFPECDNYITSGPIYTAGSIQELNCYVLGGIVTEPDSITVLPSPIDITNPPQFMQIQGAAFQSTYGWPVVQYYDLQGDFIAQSCATAVSTDQTTITTNTPDFSSLTPGVYATVVNNQASDGTLVYLGIGTINIENSAPSPVLPPIINPILPPGTPRPIGPPILPPDAPVSDTAKRIQPFLSVAICQ